MFLAVIVAVSCLLAVVLGSHGALAQTSETATPGRSCTLIQQLSVGLDLNLPVGTALASAGNQSSGYRHRRALERATICSDGAPPVTLGECERH